jgi:hypothetical protein
VEGSKSFCEIFPMFTNLVSNDERFVLPFRTTCNSIVAILTLEVTGIPELSEDREFPWPKPSFIGPTRSHLFEVRYFVYERRKSIIEPHVSSFLGRFR